MVSTQNISDEPGKAKLTGGAQQQGNQEAGRPGPAGKPTIELRVLRALRRIIRAVELHSRKLAVNHHITAPQLICLLTVADQDAMTASRLAREVHLSPSTVVGIVDRLESKGYLERQRDTADRRVVHLRVTENGRRAATAAPSPLQDTLAASLAELSELERSTIAMSLERIVELMEADHLSAAPLLGTGSLQSDPPAEAKPDKP